MIPEDSPYSFVFLSSKSDDCNPVQIYFLFTKVSRVKSTNVVDELMNLFRDKDLYTLFYVITWCLQ